MIQTGEFTMEFEIATKDMASAGSISTSIKKMLRDLGLPGEMVRRASIACYEAEMNAVIHATTCKVSLKVDMSMVLMCFDDRGPGIRDIDKAMQEGFSTAPGEVREMGFGAGMGLPNIKRNSDWMELTSQVGEGTRLCFAIYFNERD